MKRVVRWGFSQRPIIFIAGSLEFHTLREENVPFKSQSQRAKFAEMVAQGKMSQATFDEWNSETPPNLPDRVTPQSKTIKSARKIKVK